MGTKYQTDFLFARPSLLSGAASALDLWGRLPEYNQASSAAMADENAIRSDWAIVGQDIADAMGQCGLEVVETV